MVSDLALKCGHGIRSLCGGTLRRPVRPSDVQQGALIRVFSSGHIQGAHRPNGHLTSGLHDAADHTAMIDARFAPRVGRQMRLDLRKLRFRQPQLVATHLMLPFRKP